MTEPIVDYRDFISFEVPACWLRAGAKAGTFSPPTRLQSQVENALWQFAATPEGVLALKNAAARSPDGKVHIGYYEGGSSAALTDHDVNTVMIGSNDAAARYMTESGGNCDLTVQNLLYQGLQQLLMPGQEADAIAATNELMQRYFGEPPRAQDAGLVYYGGEVYSGGEPHFELSEFEAPKAGMSSG